MPFTIFVVFPSGRAASNDLYTYIGGCYFFLNETGDRH